MNGKKELNANVLKAYHQMVADKAQEFCDYVSRFEFCLEGPALKAVELAKEAARELNRSNLNMESSEINAKPSGQSGGKAHH